MYMNACDREGGPGIRTLRARPAWSTHRSGAELAEADAVADAPGCTASSVPSWVASGSTPMVMVPTTPFAMPFFLYLSLRRPPVVPDWS